MVVCSFDDKHSFQLFLWRVALKARHASLENASACKSVFVTPSGTTADHAFRLLR